MLSAYILSRGNFADIFSISINHEVLEDVCFTLDLQLSTSYLSNYEHRTRITLPLTTAN